MADTFRVLEADRLPWLKDNVKRSRRRSPSWVVPFVAASAVAIIAALSFWLGMNDALRPGPASEASVDLPLASPLEPAFQQGPVMPQVDPALVPPAVDLPAQDDVRLEAPPVKRVAAEKAVVVHRPHAPKSAVSKKKPADNPNSLNYASPWKSTGVSGRMVRVGAYPSVEKGKEAWLTLAQLSPAIKQLPAVVTDIPSPTGRTLYWLQIGTTSQAHSEVLCQRMKALGQRCVVVDLAGARKDSGNGRQPVGI